MATKMLRVCSDSEIRGLETAQCPISNTRTESTRLNTGMAELANPVIHFAPYGLLASRDLIHPFVQLGQRRVAFAATAAAVGLQR